MPVSEHNASEQTTMRIWDVPVRLFHWLLVGLLGFSWWSGTQHLMDWHRLSGCTILALLLFRLIWGVVGSATARFSHFVRGPRAVLAHLRRRATPAPGHTPIGGWSVVAMLATLTAMVLAGLFAVDVDGLESGPLADYVSFDQGRLAAEIHGWVFDALLALVALHVLAIAFYQLRLRKNLIGPMITGRGAAIQTGATPTTERGWIGKAVLCAVVSGVIALAIARGLRF